MRGRVFFWAFVMVFSLPLALLVVQAVGPGWRFPELWPARISWRAWGYVAEQGWDLGGHLASSVLYSLLTVAASLALCLAPAELLARRQFPGKTLLEALLLAPALVPSMTFSMGLQSLFLLLGLSDTLAGLVLVLTLVSYPYMLRALVAGYLAIGPDMALCATNLGAGPWRRFWRVELPLLIPAIIAGGSVVFLVAFSEYFLVFLIAGGSVGSFSGYLFPFLGSSDRAIAAALVLVFMLAPIALFGIVEVLAAVLLRRKGLW